jgi:hypothetical protein
MHQHRSRPRLPDRPVERRRLLRLRDAQAPAAAVRSAEDPLPPSAVWLHLSRQQQAQLRLTLLQTLQEVISHANGR